MSNGNFHPLTKEIKDYFLENTKNSFTEKLEKFIKIDEIDNSSEYKYSGDVIVYFAIDSEIRRLKFSDTYAFLAYNRYKSTFCIMFYYETKEMVKIEKARFGAYKSKISTDPNRLTSQYSGYGRKGKEKLFEDILLLIENIANHKVRVEYIFNKDPFSICDKDYDKSRVCLAPNITIASGKKWKDKYIKSPKLKTFNCDLISTD